jgi:flagellar biosynthesis protein FlhF
MPLETFVGPDPSELLAQARTALGADAVVLSVRRAGARGFELTAADLEAAAKIAPRPRPLAPAPAHPELSPSATQLIALVGPTGAGKSTTIAKLLRRPSEVGRRPAVLALDTHRFGAVESMRAVTKLSRTPMAVAHEERDLKSALRALKGRRTILVDTAGRGPARDADTRATWKLLDALRPDEIHLTVPAGLDPLRARRMLAEFRTRGATHLLVTKLDEFPEERTWFELAAELRVPMRWVTDGQDLRADLRPAADWDVAPEETLTLGSPAEAS